MLKAIFIILFILAISNEMQGEDDLQVAFDAATFNFDDNEARWELYFSTPDNMFSYTKSEIDDKYLHGRLIVEMKILNGQLPILENEWTISNKILSHSELNNNYIFGVRSFYLAPGQYKVNLLVYDEFNSKRRVTYNKDIIITKFDKNRINISEIQFASYLDKISESQMNFDPMYMKYDYFVIPNPRAEFYGDKSRLIGACEIYNSDKYASAGFVRSYKIVDNTKNTIFYKTDTCTEISDNILTTFNLPLDSLNSGVYFFSISVKYPISKLEDSVTSTKKFFFFNQKKPPVSRRYFTENEMFDKSEFNTFTPEQTDLELSMSLMIGTKEEINQASLLSDTKAKQRFLFRFWLKRDSDTLTAWNEDLRKFRQNVEFANSFFSYGRNKQGWKTERGRVLLKYGVPTQRDIRISTGAERSYEEWFYENVQGGVHFYFVDMSAIGNYILVHSTAMDEVFYPDWYNRYVPSTQDMRIDQDLRNERTNTNPFGQ